MKRIFNGARLLFTRKFHILILSSLLIVLGVSLYLLFNFASGIVSVSSKNIFVNAYYVLSAFIVLSIIAIYLLALGTPICANKIQNNCVLAGIKDRANNPPMLLSVIKKGNMKYYEFYSENIPLSNFKENMFELESILNAKIFDIENGKDKRHIIVKAIIGGTELPDKLIWDNDLLSQRDYVLKLGESMRGEEIIDISSTPHILIGGGTGSGKSVLAKTLLAQCILKGAKVYIADFKGGLDFSKVWHEKAIIITDNDKLLGVLDDILGELERRRTLLVDSETRNISEFNIKTNNNLNRIILCCDEVAEVLDKTGLDKEEKEKVQKIEAKISTIARLGRAFGIHLLLSTQRPDAEVLKGQIKNNVSIRICGRADKVLSQIILDNSDAVDKIKPNDIGVFVSNFVSGDGVFKAYMIEDKFLM